MALTYPFTYFTVTGTAYYTATVTFTPSITETQASTADTSIVLRPTFARFSHGVLVGRNGQPGVKLVAANLALGMLPTPLTYRVDYKSIHYAVIAVDGQKGVRREWTTTPLNAETSTRPFTFIAPSTATTINLDTVTRLDPDAVLDNWITWPS